MPRTIPGLALALVATSCGGSNTALNPIPDVPPNQQRTITHTDFRTTWPFTMATGTLGCVSDAVVFHAAGVTYAVNDAARARQFADIAPITVPRPSAPPTNPLKGVTQEVRMAIYAAAARCDQSAPSDRSAAESCKSRVRAQHALDSTQLAQIEAEGVERMWSPNVRKPASLDPIVEAGLKMCR